MDDNTYLEVKATEQAGRFVAGRVNPGVGVPFTVTAREAEHDMRQGNIVLHNAEQQIAGLGLDGVEGDADDGGDGDGPENDTAKAAKKPGGKAK